MVCLSSWDIAVYHSLLASLSPRLLLREPFMYFEKGGSVEPFPSSLGCSHAHRSLPNNM